MAADHALRRELSRRIRDDLIRLGIVAAGPAVRIADGAAGQRRGPDRVHPQRPRGRGGGARPDAGQRRPAPHRGGHPGRADRPPGAGRRPGHRSAAVDRPASSCYADYQDAELGYAVTDHVAQGRTVHTGLAVITGTEDRQHAYVALTRGTDTNMAYVFTVSPKLADPAPGPRPAPELARYDRLTAGHAAQPAAGAPGPGTRWECWPACWTETASSCPRPRPGSRPWPTPITWPSCTRSGPPRPPRPASSTTGTCSWPTCRPNTGAEPGHQARWLWRTLRAAELAGLDPGASPGRRDRRTGPGRRPRPGRRHRRPAPLPDRRPRPGPGGPVVGPGPRHRRPRAPRLRRRRSPR